MTYDINDISEKLVSDVKIEEECESDNQNFGDESKALQIRRSENVEGALMCELCPTILKSKANLEIHIETFMQIADISFCW